MRTLLVWLVRLAIALVLFIAGAWVFNASFWSSYRAPLTILAHRGMHQTYGREGLERDTCTATRIYPVEHTFLENTLDSMEAAFAKGADVVEFDIHPTTDGQFAVFHDWTLDCRTDGKGVTREQTMAYLKTLDIGYGYTADGGKTFPFRGQFVGQMPTLDEVLARFPDKRFLINIKSRYRSEGEKLAARLKQLPQAQQRLLMSYGGQEPEDTLRAAMPGMRTLGRRQLRDCLVNYLALGWSGHVPEACRTSMILVPRNYAWALWGWPNRFVERMHGAGSEVYLVGDYGAGDPGTTGIDTIDAARAVPADFPGGVWTNRIERVGPALKPARP